jgi:hypothetical protein
MGFPVWMPRADIRVRDQTRCERNCSRSTTPTPDSSVPNTFALKELRWKFLSERREEIRRIGRVPPMLVDFSHQSALGAQLESTPVQGVIPNVAALQAK